MDEVNAQRLLILRPRRGNRDAELRKGIIEKLFLSAPVVRFEPGSGLAFLLWEYIKGEGCHGVPVVYQWLNDGLGRPHLPFPPLLECEVMRQPRILELLPCELEIF